MKKIKILQFTIASSKGGSTQYILQNWKYIDRSKFQFDFVTMSKTLDFADKLEQDGCKVFYISCYAEEDKDRFIYEIRKILLEGQYDVVHLHTKFWKSFIVEQLAKELGVNKIIVHAHNTGVDTLDEKKRKEEQRIHNDLLKDLTEDIATDYWACSKVAADFLFGSKIPGQKIKIMKNAINLSNYEYNPKIRKKYRKKLGITDEYVIGNVARFAYQKNQEFLIEVFFEIYKDRVNDNKDYKLLLIGSGEKEREYREIVEKKNLEENVIFAGQRTDVPELLQVMDVFCLPSRFEGLPISMLEAQASGLPCIGSDCITSEVKICDDVVLLPLVKAEWKNQILQYLEKNRRDNKMRLIEAGYDIDNQIKVIEKYYEGGVILYKSFAFYRIGACA